MTGKRRNGTTLALAAALLTTALFTTGCSSENGSGSAAGDRTETIRQPSVDDPRIAPERKRVDLAAPTGTWIAGKDDPRR